jgi:phospholipid transport system substrate-binding protein
MRKVPITVLVAVLLAVVKLQAAGAADASAVAGAEAPIQSLYTVLLSCMKQANTLGEEGRAQHMAPVLEQTYDFPFMAEKSLGRYWKTLTPEQQTRWVDAFRRMTIYTYASRFDGYDGEKLEILGAEPSLRDTVIVRTQIAPKDEDPVAINYRMHQVDGSWKAIDAYMDGAVSELALRRSEDTSAFKRDGFDKLVESMLKKAKETKGKGT